MFEFCAGNRVLSFRKETHRTATFGECFGDLLAVKQERRRVAGVDELQFAVPIEDAKKHGGIAADTRVFAEELIDMVKDSGRVGADGHPEECALEHGGEKRGAKSF